jgi:chemotaxis protein methyltransferase CheR
VSFATLLPPVPLTDEGLHLLNEVLDRHFGLFFPPHRRAVLEARLQPRLRALTLDDVLDYCTVLQVYGNGELDQLARAVTNNETYFFRECDQMDALFTQGVELLRPGLAVSGRLRLLSAGCSSGEEAFTLAFRAREASLLGLDVQIDAFDLDGDRLAIAHRAEYRPRSLRQMTPAQVGRYLQATGPDRYTVKDTYRAGVTFAPGNLVAPESFRRQSPYDAVFCRNVLIYFSERSLRRAVANLVDALRPGGLLFLGHSESVIGMFPTLETVRLGPCIAYRKVAR